MSYKQGNIQEQVNKDKYKENTAYSSSIFLGNIYNIRGVETKNNYEGRNFQNREFKGLGGSKWEIKYLRGEVD